MLWINFWASSARDIGPTTPRFTVKESKRSWDAKCAPAPMYSHPAYGLSHVGGFGFFMSESTYIICPIPTVWYAWRPSMPKSLRNANWSRLE